MNHHHDDPQLAEILRRLTHIEHQLTKLAELAEPAWAATLAAQLALRTQDLKAAVAHNQPSKE